VIYVVKAGQDVNGRNGLLMCDVQVIYLNQKVKIIDLYTDLLLTSDYNKILHLQLSAKNAYRKHDPPFATDSSMKIGGKSSILRNLGTSILCTWIFTAFTPKGENSEIPSPYLVDG